MFLIHVDIFYLCVDYKKLKENNHRWSHVLVVVWPASMLSYDTSRLELQSWSIKDYTLYYYTNTWTIPKQSLSISADSPSLPSPTTIQQWFWSLLIQLKVLFNISVYFYVHLFLSSYCHNLNDVFIFHFLPNPSNIDKHSLKTPMGDSFCIWRLWELKTRYSHCPIISDGNINITFIRSVWDDRDDTLIYSLLSEHHWFSSRIH